MNRSVFTAVVFAALAGASAASAQDATVKLTDLGAVLKAAPADDKPARVVETFIANKSQLQVLTIKNIKLHHHALEDHVVYVAQGAGKGRIETAPGKIEEKEVKAGDFYLLPKNLKHAFQAADGLELVMLVVATAGWKPLEDTTFHE